MNKARNEFHISSPNHKCLFALGIISINCITYSSMVNSETMALETYIVTGERIDKNITDVTTAVTVIPGEQLESGEKQQAKETAAIAPNVISSSFSNIAIRGVSGGGAATGGLAYLTGARARVVTVVDGVTQDFSGYNFSPVSVWDIAQLEVLRGPQSTAQGSSAIGGALVINTLDPTFYSEAAIRGGLEHYKNGNNKYNYGVMSSNAIIEDELAYRLVIDGTKGKGWLNYDTKNYNTPNLSESESLNARGKLLWKPTSIPALTAKLTLNYSKNEGEHANFASNTAKGIDSNTFTLDGTNEVRIQDSDANSVAVDVDYEIRNGLNNSLHISHASSDIHDDAYSTGNIYDINNDTYTFENRLLLTGDDTALTGVVGVFVSEKEADLSTSNFNITTDYQTTTAAVYGEGTYSITDDYRVVTGLRIENEDSDKSSSTRFSNGSSKQNESETYYLPKLSLMHELLDSTTIAATVSKGYSPSGVGISFFGEEYSYGSETVTAFELSSKSILAGGTSLNANLFYNDYKDYQAGTSSFTIENVDESHTLGIEIEGITWIGDSLELRSSIGLLESKIDSDNAYQGKELTDAPNTNIALGFTQYIQDSWSVGADVVYVGEYYSDLENTDSGKAGDYTLIDIRASYNIGEFTFNAYMKNLTDEDAVYYRAGSLASVGQSRTVGISGIYRM